MEQTNCRSVAKAKENKNKWNRSKVKNSFESHKDKYLVSVNNLERFKLLKRILK